MVGALREEPRPAVWNGSAWVELPPDPRVALVVRTLRYTAGVLAEGEVDDALADWIRHWREAADALELIGLDDGGCCVVCQEVVCDDDCPMAGLRA